MSAATISPCGTYRYTLHRWISQPRRWVRPMLFVMLNPSVADAAIDDPTIRRCIGFAAREGCTEMTVVNLFALRSTDPDGLFEHADPIGPENDWHITDQVGKHRIGFTVVAWGAFQRNDLVAKRVERVRSLLPKTALCLGVSKDGFPRHPLMLKNAQEFIPYPV